MEGSKVMVILHKKENILGLSKNIFFDDVDPEHYVWIGHSAALYSQMYLYYVHTSYEKFG